MGMIRKVPCPPQSRRGNSSVTVIARDGHIKAA